MVFPEQYKVKEDLFILDKTLKKALEKTKSWAHPSIIFFKSTKTSKTRNLLVFLPINKAQSKPRRITINTILIYLYLY